MSISDSKLDFWIQNNFNVLFVGRHGVGKTAMVTSAFDRNNLKWMYFSASTMDPWVDFIGVPKEQKDEKGNAYLDLVRPKAFQDDEVEALFFDEYNRSHKKVRNAVMELIQFKSINGRKFKNLRFIWAAINPSDDDESTYDVDKLDPAQEDRFHIKVEVPFTLPKEYLVGKYGREKALATMSWWNELPKEVQSKISPRRVEYALMIHQAKGDIRDVLPKEGNIQKLLLVFSVGPVKDKLKELFDSRNTDEAKSFLAVENNYSAAVQHLTSKADWMEFFVPLLSSEKLSSLCASDAKVLKLAQRLDGTDASITKTLDEICAANQNKSLVQAITKERKLRSRTTVGGGNPDKAFFNTRTTEADFLPVLNKWKSDIMTSTSSRSQAYEDIKGTLPRTLTPATAAEVIGVFGKILVHSQAGTINEKLTKVIGMINHCINQIHLATGKSYDEIFTEYKPHMNQMVGKLVEIQAGTRLFCPQKKAGNLTMSVTPSPTGSVSNAALIKKGI